jgi:tetratricopeptide (TPR) repeat protein
VDALRTAVKLDPKRLQAWQQLGLLLSAAAGKDAWAQAAKAWEQAARLAPQDGRLRLNQALALARLGQDADALSLLERAAQMQGGQGAWRSLCVLYNKAGKADKAADACAKAVDNGGGAESWYNLGYARQRLGKGAEARAAFKKALEADPHHAPSLYALAFLDFEAGDPDKALAGFKAALAARGGDYPEAQYNAATLLSDLGRYEEAAGLYRDLLTRDPGNSDAKAALNAAVTAGTASLLGDGRDAYERGDFAAAGKAWERAAALDPGNEEAARLMKQAKAKSHAALAAAAARKAARERVTERLKADDAKVLKRGLAALKAGQLDEAVRLLDFYLKKNPNDASARHALFNARARQLEAQSGPSAAPRVRPTPTPRKADADAVKRLYYAGVEQYLAGDLAGAVTTWKKVLAQDPDNLDAQRSLARAELELEALRKRATH